ncbi:uncharacterized protein LOC127568686 [Pristis pectinata]|uniref:uncharacterized protein LOC127568686 n=1 Tax=Pristis pectinata TaxID=685728 RepID=UPI00223D234B|nr:uncharacterized protein LOC127568686 [Pristis pectinata]
MSNKRLSAVTLFLCIAVGLKATTVLIQSPGDVKVREGETVLIQCVLESNDVQNTVDKFPVHWYNSRNKLNQEGIVLSLYVRGGVYRSRGFSDRFQLSRNVTSNSYSLTISDVKTADSGDYICAIWGTVFGKGTNLNVTSADVPVLMQSPSLEHVTEGHTARLRCTITRARVEDTDVHWYRKLPGQDLEWVLTHKAGGSLQWRPGFTERFLPYRDTANSSFILTVTDMEHSDSAVYYCRVWGDISGNGTQLIVGVHQTDVYQAVKTYLTFLVLVVLLAVLAVTGGILLIRHRALGSHQSPPPAAAEDQTPAADHENVSKAREIPDHGVWTLKDPSPWQPAAVLREGTGEARRQMTFVETLETADAGIWSNKPSAGETRWVEQHLWRQRDGR